MAHWRHASKFHATHAIFGLAPPAAATLTTTHGLTLVTRTTRDVEALLAPALNPWDATGAA
jgi:hypothetical protein